MKHLSRLFISTLLLIYSMFAFAADRLEIYQLNQRTAAEIIPIIGPLLPQGSAINGNGYQLLVRGNEQAHAAVRQALEKLDSKLNNLIISVRFSTPSTHVQRSSGAEIRANSGDVSVRAGEAPRQGSEIGVSDGKSSVRITDKTTTTRRDDNSKYRLRVLEGNTAFIQTGEAIPYGTQTQFPGGATQNSIEFRQTRSGFLVRPRLNGNKVLLDILPSQESQSPQGGGVIDTSKIQTTISGNLGEWIELGGVSSSNQQEKSGTLYSTRQQRNLSSHVFLKVEKIH